MPGCFRYALILIFGVTLAGCQSTRSAHYGSGPLTLTPGVKAAYEQQYLQAMTPGMFLVTTDGRGAYWIYCPASTCADSISMYAIQNCEARYKTTCKIYADGRGVVWKFDQPAAPAATKVDPAPAEERPQAASVTSHRSAQMISRRVELIWEGRPQSIIGAVQFQRGQDTGTMSVDLPDGMGVCNGTYAVVRTANKGSWSLVCPNGVSATGSLVIFPPNKGANGHGVDSNGRKVAFVVAGE